MIEVLQCQLSIYLIQSTHISHHHLQDTPWLSRHNRQSTDSTVTRATVFTGKLPVTGYRYFVAVIITLLVGGVEAKEYNYSRTHID